MISRTANTHGTTIHGLVPGDLVPGVYVRHPDVPEWGLGQVQSCVGTRVTVNFEERGKVLIDTSVVGLVAADAEIDAC